MYLGWGGERPAGPVSLGAEARLGSAITSIPSGVSDAERELLIGGAGWVRADVGGGWSLRGEVAAARVYAHRVWDPVTLSLGVTRALDPGAALASTASTPGPMARADSVGEDGPPWWTSFPDVPEGAFGRGVGTDRLDYRWSPGSLRVPEAGSPTYWLDGIPIRDATLGGPSWAWLPLGSADIGRIQATDRPALLRGRPELEGALHATTAPLPAGRTVRVRGLILNESGDPGRSASRR